MAENKLFGFLNAQRPKNDSVSPPSPISWEQFLNKTSEDIDRLLIEHARKENLIYVGGKCRMTATHADGNGSNYKVNVDVELYYKVQFKKEKNFQIYPLHKERKFEDFDLTDEGTKQQLEKLKNEQYEFNVEEPQLKDEKEQ